MKYERVFCCGLAALIICCKIYAGGAAEPPWSAQWIGPDSAGSNTWLCFRKSVSFKEVPATLSARIAVDSKYWLWLNGRLVVFEGGLKRGPTPEDTYYDRVELAPYLKRGVNTIAVLVWYWGKDGFSHNSSGKAGLLFEAQASDQTIVSDDTWKVLQHPAFGTDDPPYPNYRLPEFNVHFDARHDIPGWFKPGFEDAGWPAATSFGVPPVVPWNNLELRPIPEWRNSELKEYIRVQKTNDAKGNQVLEAILPYDAQVTPWLCVQALAGCRIDIRTDDYMGGGSPNVRSVYITRKGIQEFESLGWMNGHRVIYTAPAAVQFRSVKYRETGYNADIVGEFHCDDAALNTLWQKARRTLYVTMRDNYMDCPDRERAQWWGDEVNELGETFYVFDAANGPLLARKGIRELARWQRADHTLYAPVPAGRPASDVRHDLRNGAWNVELPLQMLAAVGYYGFWNYYLYTGDHDTLALAYPHVREYLNRFRQDANGLILHSAGDWDWADWGANIDVNVLDSAWYYLALKGAIQMAQVCGQPADVLDWQARQAAIEKGFNATFWNGREYRSPAYQGETDDRVNALAVVAGLAKPEQYAALREVFARHQNASPYMEKYVIEALYQINAPDDAMRRMKARWKDQIEGWTTTLWEGWGIGDEKFGGGTYNHAWSGGALTVLSQYAAGVAPEEPAYRKYHVMPCLGGLQTIQSEVPTPNGNIKLDIEQDGRGIRLNLSSPLHTTARVGLPIPAGKSFRNIIANGTVVWEKNGLTVDAVGVALESADARMVRLLVAPGIWHFKGYYE